MQTDCGHVFCNDCLQDAMSSGEKILCPINGEKISGIYNYEMNLLSCSLYSTDVAG